MPRAMNWFEPGAARPSRFARWLDGLRHALARQRQLDEQALRLQIRKRQRP